MASHDIGAVRPIASALPKQVSVTSSGASGPMVSGPTPDAGLALSEVLDPGTPPIDRERISRIKQAVEAGTYPLVPHTVADAMIAAGFLLRFGE